MKPIIDKEDKDMALDYIVLNLLIEKLEQDILLLPDVGLKLIEPYENYFNDVIRRIKVELYQLRLKLKERQIKVHEPKEVNEDFISYPYVVRGYSHEFRFLKAALNNHQLKRLNQFFGVN